MDRFHKIACDRLQAIYNARGIAWEWQFCPKSTEEDNTTPDFVLRAEGGEELLVGEGKVRTAIEVCRQHTMHSMHCGTEHTFQPSKNVKIPACSEFFC